MARMTKKKKFISEKMLQKSSYTIEEGVIFLKELASKKFNETFEVAVNLNLDTRHANQTLRGVCQLPHGTGKTLRVAVFAKGKAAEEAKEAGADIVGAEDLVQSVLDGDINFDKCVASPDMMPLVGRVGKQLGTRGLMPNPKNGTVTPEVGKAVSDIKKGSVDYRADKAGIVHAPIGLVEFDDQKLIENFNMLLDTVIKAKPAGAKGKYLESVHLTTTQGPGIKIESLTVH